MASSSSSSYPALASQSSNWDVFLSFRGEDTRKTFVDHLYTALLDRKIHTYKDDEALPRGDSIRPSLYKAIEGSQIAVIIFSKNYAESSWCLEELAYIMKCKDKRGLVVEPVFYDVVPSEVRKQEGDFGRGFAKQEARNINKVESWRKALVDASEIAGWEPKNIANGHESKVIRKIVDTISGMLFFVNAYDDENLVGMSARLQELEAQVDIGSHGVRMIGVWGVGGSGKTTLASSLYMKISRYFEDHCFIENVREKSSKHGLETLQDKIISSLLKTKMELSSIEERKRIIRTSLKRSKVLILLDDVDDYKQLDALVGSHECFGSGSRIVITTRDEHVLRAHKVDYVCKVTLLSREEAIMLFNKHAYNINNPINDYEELSLRVVSYSSGLPLALKVLGYFLYDKDEKEWVSSLARLKEIPEMEIVEKLKISYDGLKNVEKELFLDIACFFRGEIITINNMRIFGDDDDDVMELLEACGYHPDIGIKVLAQKGLVSIVNGRFDMHDLVQEMGHYIVRGEHPNNPERHSRVWKQEEIINMRLGDATMENNKIEAIKYVDYHHPFGDVSSFYKNLSNMKKLKWLSLTAKDDRDENVEGPSFLSNELQYIRWRHVPGSPFPDSFQPKKLATLKLHNSLQKQLWKDYKHAPHLKVLELTWMTNLLSTPNFDGLPCLQKLTLFRCDELQEIHPTLGKHKSIKHIKVKECHKLRRWFPVIVHMGKVKTLEIIKYLPNGLEFPEIKSNMESLEKLSLCHMGIDNLLSSIGDRCPNLISIDLADCSVSKNKEVNLHGLNHLEEVSIERLKRVRHQLLVLPQLTHKLRKLSLVACHLKDGEIPSGIGELSNLQELDLWGNHFTRLDFSLLQLNRLKHLTLNYCKSLVEFPKLPSGVAIVYAFGCESLTTFGDFYTNCKCLCQVYTCEGGVVTVGNRLLQHMLEGNAIENNPMMIALEGLEIAKGFTSPLVRGTKCRLKLPEKWSNDFSGFLLCAVAKNIQQIFPYIYFFESMSIKRVLSGMDLEEDAVWEESNDDRMTSVLYFPFSLIRHTAWWDPAHKEVLFSFGKYDEPLSGVGVRLVAKKSASASGPPTEEEESEFFNYAPQLEVESDSTDAIRLNFVRKARAFDAN